MSNNPIFSIYLLLVLSTIHFITDATSRYFIDYYSDDYNPLPTPINVCLNHFGSYVVAKCNISDANTHLLIKEDHGANQFCNSSNATITIYTKHLNATYSYDNIIGPYSFNCIGEDNYAQYTVYPTTDYCNSSLQNNTFHDMTYGVHYDHAYYVTDICVSAATFNIMYECNAFFFALYVDVYPLNPCNRTKQRIMELSPSTRCSYRFNFPTRMTQCIKDGIAITIDAHNLSFEAPLLSQKEREALVDIWAINTDYGVNGGWISCDEQWNLTRIAMEGNIYKDDGYSDICHVSSRSNNETGKVEIYGLNFTDTQLSGTIPETICDLKDLELLVLHEPHLSGSIPECVGNDLLHLEIMDIEQITTTPYINGSLYNGTDIVWMTGVIPSNIGNLPNLWYLSIAYTKVSGSLPSSICNMTFKHNKTYNNESYHGLYINIVDTYITGSIPDCFVSQNDTLSRSHTLIVSSNAYITGTIPSSICNLQSFEELNFMANNHIYGSIPLCFGDINVREFFFVSMQGLSGTVPDGVYCKKTLMMLAIQHNINMERQTIPECFSEPKDVLGWIWLQNSNFHGTFPALPAGTKKWSPLLILNIADNNFEGTLSDIFGAVFAGKLNTSYLVSVVIDNNNFYEEDISDLLEFLWTNAPHLSYLSIANNPNIHGTIPNVDNVTSSFLNDAQSSTSFIAHNCDLYGTLPQSLHFTNLDFLTLQNNRLSGEITTHFKNYRSNLGQYQSVILLGNLFWQNGAEPLPKWIDSPLKNAANLYYSNTAQTQSIFMIVISGLCIIAVCVEAIYYRICHKQYTDSKDTFEFFHNMEFLEQRLTDYRMLLIVFVLVIFYPFVARFYYIVPYESLFSISYYYNMNRLIWMDWILLLLAAIYHFMVLLIVTNLVLDKRQNDKLLPATQSDQERSEIVENEDPLLKIVKYRAFWSVLYFVLWIFGMFLISMYLMATTLPDDNVLDLNQTTAILLTKMISIILIINNSYIIPGFISHTFPKSKYKFQMIAILRINNNILLPIFSSLFILNDCGKWWINSWDHCVDDDLSEKFNIRPMDWNNYDANVADVFEGLNDAKKYSTVLNSDEICVEPSLLNINFNRCMRSFLYHWTSVLLMKVIFSICFQIVGVLIKKIKHKIKGKAIEIAVDDLWIVIIMELTTAITFSFCTPLLFVLSVFDIILKKYLHRIMIYKMNFNFKMKHKSASVFPVEFLYFGVIIGQLLAVLFFIFCVANIAVVWLFFGVVLLMDVLLIMFSYKIPMNRSKDTKKSISLIEMKKSEL